MYRVVNKTSKNLFFEGSDVKPNQEVVVCNSVFDMKGLKDEQLGGCEITSKYGKHSCSCFGNITCTPQKGCDGTVFEISEK